MQATVHEARKSGSWVVVLNAGHEPDMMLTLLAALERDHSGYTHPNFRLIICLSQQSDCDLTWALTSQAYTVYVELLRSPNKDLSTLLHVWEYMAPKVFMATLSMTQKAVKRAFLSVVAAHASISWEQTSSHF